MSMQQILDTVDGLLKDANVGFAAKLSALAGGDAIIRTDFDHVAWTVPLNNLSDTRKPNVVLRAGSWVATTKASDVGHRDADASLKIGYVYFGADGTAIQRNSALAATALAQAIDELRAYSDAHHESLGGSGTIIEVIDPMIYEFDQYAGPTSNGFLATLTLTERSSQ